MCSLEQHYSAADIETRILAGIRAAGLDTDRELSPAELGALDHFHTGGLQASRELLVMAKLAAEHQVLDVGAGLAGCARLLAAEVGCRVDCIEMSVDYCTGAQLLNRLTGLEERIAVRQGSALEMPYPDNTFDAVWMQNVGMNIAPKQRLYSEIVRVMKPGGRFVFQEVVAGHVPLSYFPLPWATEPAHSHLVNTEELLSLLEGCGLVAERFEDVSDTQLGTNVANSTPAPEGQLGLKIFVDDLAEKAGNARRGLEEGQIRYVRGVFRLC